MIHHSLAVCFVLLASVVGAHSIGADQAKSKTVRAPKEIALNFCREQSLIRLKYKKTVEWLDNVREEKAGTWFIAGIRTADSPSGEVNQQYSCRVQVTGGGPVLRMIQIFKESSKTGKDIFELRNGGKS